MTDRMRSRATDTVRARLAAATDAVHTALHEHPVLGAMLRPDLSASTYLSILIAYQRFYSAVEQGRTCHQAYPALSLALAVEALEQDLHQWHPTHQAVELTLPWLDSPPAILGALYVLHGAGFGGRVLSRHVARSQPLAPRRFLQTGPSHDTWCTLCDTLEHVGTTHYAELELGAHQAFAFLAQEVTVVAASAKPLAVS